MELLLSKSGIRQSTFQKIGKYLLCLYIFLSFFEGYLNQILGSVTKYLMFIIILYYLAINRKIQVKFYHYFYLIWFIYKILSATWSSNFEIFDLHFLSHVGLTGMLMVLTLVELDTDTIKAILYSMLLSSFLMGVMSIFMSQPYLGDVESRLVLTLFGTQVDPNNQSAFLLFGVCIALYFCLYLKKNILINLVIILVNVYSIMRTGSRGGLLSLLAIAVFSIFFTGKKFSFKMLVIRFLVVLALCVALLFIATKFLNVETFERIFDMSSYEDGSERTKIWAKAKELILTDYNLIFGGGWGSLYGYSGMFKAGHNTYVSMLCDVGLIGSFLFFIPIIYVIIKLLKKRQILPVIILISGLVPCFFLDAINKRYFWNPIIIAFIFYNFTVKNKNAKAKQSNG